MDILDLVHKFICVIMYIPALIPSKNFKLFSYFSLIAILASWIIFDGCLMWDIQKKFDKNFSISKDCLGRKFGMSNKTWSYVQAILVYSNFIGLGIQLGRPEESLGIFLVYLILNGQFITRPMSKVLKEPGN